MSEPLLLCQAFLSGAPAFVSWPASPALEESLRGLFSTATAAWPDLSVPADAFAAHLGERLTQEDAERGPSRYGGGLAAADLLLAAACLLGHPRAVEIFEREILARVPGLVGHMNQPPAWVAELQQDLAEDLLVSSSERRAKLSQYRGRGSLAGWFSSVAIRTALNRVTRGAPRTDPLEDNATDHLIPLKDAEADVLRRRYGPLFEEAVRQAFSGLQPEQRNMIRLYYADKLTVTQIAALFKVHHTTVVRSLAGARGAVLADVRRILGERLGIDSSEFRSIVRVALSDLEISMSGLLRAG